MGLRYCGRCGQHAWAVGSHRRGACSRSGHQWRSHVGDVFDHQSFPRHGQILFRRLWIAAGHNPLHAWNAHGNPHRQWTIHLEDPRLADHQLGGNWAELNVALTVVGANPPVVTSQPASLTVAPGQSASLTAAYSGDEPVALRWFKEDLEVKNATNATLTLPSAQAADSGRYRLRLINDLGTVFSDWATLTVQATVDKPVISVQPVGRRLHEGETFALQVSASGTNLTYAWTRDGVVVGDSGSTLSLTNAAVSLAGVYRVRVTNPGGSVDSDAASVGVVGPVLWDPPTQVSDSLRLTFNGLEGRRYAVESAVGLSGPFTPLAEMMGQAGGPCCSIRSPARTGSTGHARCLERLDRRSGPACLKHL